MSDDLDWVAASVKRAKGKRPDYFDDPATDRLMSIVLALAAEVSVLRQRHDTVERLLATNGTLSRDDIEAYSPDAATARERGLETRAYIARIMRGVTQAMDAMAVDEKPVEEVSRELRDL
ncbi:hypothetical protein [Sphingomonas antarctica]|uniref:hypothetical protein n=1 Tax=Sphingomonas antarctica TaxID=2040274 RepID=UPI0039E79395